ncbi:MAG: hypothetical protein H8E48_07270, partial [Chloroflexi bacterium]|nr:hypothetical protein [Chloroflexota bacterium]
MKAFGLSFLLLVVALALVSCSSGVSSSGEGTNPVLDKTMAGEDSQQSGLPSATSAKVVASSIGP